MSRPSRAQLICPRVPTLQTIRDKGENFLGAGRVFGRQNSIALSSTAQRMSSQSPEQGLEKLSPSGSPYCFAWRNQAQLQAKGIHAISVDAQTVSPQVIQDITARRYRVVIVNPELALANRGPFEKLWRDRTFVSKIISIVWDEAHCISTWGAFRKEYAEAGRLRSLLVEEVPANSEDFAVKRPPECLPQRSQDTPLVEELQRSSFLIPENWTPGAKLPKFLLFFDSIQESVDATKSLWNKMPEELRHRIVWFNSHMTLQFREQTTNAFKVSGANAEGPYILGCTDSFGLGVDVPDIDFVGQWRATCDMNTLWQRFGRVGRGPGTEGVAVLFAESKYFDNTRAKAAQAAEVKNRVKEARANEAETRKRTLTELNADSTNRLCADNLPAPAATATNGNNGVLSVYESLRVEYYQSAAGISAKHVTSGKTSHHVGIVPEMDNLINASTRPFCCYRVPIMAFYQNDRRVPDHLQCAETPTRCRHCNLTQSAVCCDLCNDKSDSPSDIFKKLVPPLTEMEANSAHGPSIGRASRLPKYTMTASDFALRAKLDDFRCQNMLNLYGYAQSKNMGPTDIMCDNTLECIASCARFKKLVSPEDFRREVPKWRRVHEFGGALMVIIQKHYPVTGLYATTPLRQRQPAAHNLANNTSTSAADSLLSTKKNVTCSACKTQGHTLLIAQ
ncbi:P-loop containing nucleoside triphosphate hydrolase protein [Cytidiella melzeri]|nr:P-loop containing nucleoside triphosphate hydrolase protein [Cytidiella melzeri]